MSQHGEFIKPKILIDLESVFENPIVTALIPIMGKNSITRFKKVGLLSNTVKTRTYAATKEIKNSELIIAIGIFIFSFCIYTKALTIPTVFKIAPTKAPSIYILTANKAEPISWQARTALLFLN